MNPKDFEMVFEFDPSDLAELVKNIHKLFESPELDTSEEAAELAVKQVDWDFRDFRLTVGAYFTNPCPETLGAVCMGLRSGKGV